MEPKFALLSLLVHSEKVFLLNLLDIDIEIAKKGRVVNSGNSQRLHQKQLLPLDLTKVASVVFRCVNLAKINKVDGNA